MPTDFEPFKRLPPETKVIELRKLITVLKKHIDEHQRDIRTAESLLNLAEDEQKVIEQETERAETRKVKGKETAEAKPAQEELEKIVGREDTKQRIEETARRPLSELYQELRSIYQSQQKTGIETQEQRDRVYELSRGLYEKRKDMEEGTYKSGEQQKHLLTSTEQLISAIYQDNKEQQRPYRRTE